MRAPVLPVLVLAALLGACSERRERARSEEPRTPPEVTQAWRGSGAEIELSVWEMHCAGCQSAVKESLAAIEGVTSVEADWKTSVVRVRIADPSLRDAAIARIREAVHAGDRRVLGEDSAGG
jgi:copper chaperone CopZ